MVFVTLVRLARTATARPKILAVPAVTTLYRALADKPFGKRVFSVVYAQAAPYFASVRPRVIDVRPNRAELVIRKRRRVQNHLKTVHVIAICNGLEAAMGLVAEASIPVTRRWIPKGMDVRYLAKATSDIRCVAETDPDVWSGPSPEVPVRVQGIRDDGTVVVDGVIHLWVTDRPDHAAPSGRRPLRGRAASSAAE